MKISERGQLTIPKNLRDRYGLHKDVEISLVASSNGIVIRKQSRIMHPVDKVLGILRKAIDTDQYIEELRGR
ncbi:MAG: AbrB/MazE/SpoVT family DNA-binding domain-containing protein [Desulfobacterales bacterium]